MRVALVQITVDDDPAANIARAVEEIERAADAGARLVVLPEATLAPFGTDLRAAARDHADAFEQTLAEVAERRDVVVAAGGFVAADDGRVRNVVHVRGRGVRADYAKIHLFDAFGTRESDTIAPGEDLVTVDVDGWRIGVATCYDVRFPEQFRALADAGAEAVVLPTAWNDGEGKEEQWRVLVRARALDATLVVLAADQAPPVVSAGAEAPPSARGIGCSQAVGADGRVLAELGREEGAVLVDLDRASVARVRETLPVLRHRVPLGPSTAG
ncbi:nitrilase-related carbon-nitrogen hydrolase [Brachybacterium huguangmaarense]